MSKSKFVGMNYYIDNSSGACNATADTNTYYVDVGTTTDNTNNINWTDTTAGAGTYWINTPTQIWGPPLDKPSVEVGAKPLLVQVTPDDPCKVCDLPLGMFCEKGHYIKTDNEEYRFVHSIKCNEKLSVLYRIDAFGKRHVECPKED